MRSTRHLMSIEQAAGFAMAPSEDDMAMPHEPHPDDALRNGHVTAARAGADEAATPATQLIADANSTGQWLRETLTALWPGGRAHA